MLQLECRLSMIVEGKEGKRTPIVRRATNFLDGRLMDSAPNNLVWGSDDESIFSQPRNEHDAVHTTSGEKLCPH
jgi:hypothetical protein